MIKANHNKISELVISLYISHKFKKQFSSLKIINQIKAKNKAILLLSNHFSWWDGFWVLMLNKKIWKKRFHVMMLENQLKNNKILNNVGAYSIQPGSRDIINSLNYSIELLKKKNSLVLMYPQGVFNSMYSEKFEFNSGINYILKRNKSDIQIVFTAFFTEYFDNSKPSLYCYLEEFEDINYQTTNIENQYNQFYQRCLKKQKLLKK
jgi:hypothetical protein